MILSADPLRWAGALALGGGYAAMCLAIWRARVARRPAPPVAGDWLVVHASQTGGAEYLAHQSAELLATGGLAAQVACISALDPARLRAATRILFIASTYGEGDAPDCAARFAGVTMTGGLDLSHLHYAVLALGDSSYANYCGFGRALDSWLAGQGAAPLFERIEVDRGAPGAIEDWRHHLARLAGTSDTPDWEAPAYRAWRIAARKLLNPGSSGAPLYRIELVPATGPLPAWEAGDLVQVSAPADPAHAREYSVASVPSEGALVLLVRLRRREDGSTGLASGWLCEQAGPEDMVALRLRTHARFRLGTNMRRPLVAIGNGSGLAGLRAHLKARIDAGEHANWLVFGERNRAHDFLCRDELQSWRDAGQLPRLSLAFSRDGAGPRYVQDALRAEAAELAAWVGRGAAIYVCGSLQGMAAGVHQALVDILGAAEVERLTQDGRYRRDVY